MGKLSGKVAIITGGASGMGAAETRMFLSEGACVVFTDINPKGAEIASELGDKALFVEHDVASQAGWAKVVAGAEERFGRIDILVNNAGIGRLASLEDSRPDDFQAIFQTNQFGVFLGMQSVIAPMKRAGGGSIINISSAVALRGYPGQFGYSSTKWAVRGMTKCAAIELAGDKIRVNTVLPGLTATPLLMQNSPEFNEELARGVPMKRMAGVDEIGRAVLFLASDESSYITGVDLQVDGGGTI